MAAEVFNQFGPTAMSRYAFEDLSDEQFEKLIVLICQKLLGISVKGFATGVDGGRDARFHGIAQLFPSTAGPWNGKTIVQAKHTNGYNKHFNETDFYSRDSKSSVLHEELPKIKKLRDDKDLDHYMLFANRRLGAIADNEITKHISSVCGISESSVYLCGIEQLELWLKQFPDIAVTAQLDLIDSPLIVSSDDLAEVIQSIAQHKSEVAASIDHPPTERVTYERKNQLNNMTPEFAKELRQKYLKETMKIRSFLAAPGNDEILHLYESIIDEFQMKIIAHRKDYQTFDKVMIYILDLLFDRDAILRQHRHKRLTRILLFYMYWNCDIGEVENAETV